MKEIELSEVKKLASLSALEFSDEELEKFIPEFSNILNMVNEVQKCDTKDVELSYSSHKLASLRQDEAREGLEQEEVLLNSPKTKKGCFAVPQMLED